jgi:hypothetical protein
MASLVILTKVVEGNVNTIAIVITNLLASEINAQTLVQEFAE